MPKPFLPEFVPIGSEVQPKMARLSSLKPFSGRISLDEIAYEDDIVRGSNREPY